MNFERHNAEVKEVWESYRARRPIRVPCILGTNTRYFLLGDPAPISNIDFKEYTEDKDLMFETQVRWAYWLRHHLPQDAPMGLPSKDEGWTVRVDFQNYTEAAWFGCKVAYHAGQVPDTMPRWNEEERKREVLERGIPDPFGSQMAKNLKYYEYFLKKARDYTFKGRKVQSVMPRGLGTDGPLTVAVNLRGASELFLDFMEDPDYVRELLNLVTEATITRIQAWRRYLGQPEKSEEFGFADDAIQMLSSNMYREFVLPCHKRLRDALCTREQGGSIHLCGDASRHFTTLRDELGIQSFDTGFPIDFAKLRSDLGPDIEIKGGPHVELMRSGTPQKITERAREILESGIMNGGRFVLREGNNLAPGTPLENVQALYDVARTFGRYKALETFDRAAPTSKLVRSSVNTLKV